MNRIFLIASFFTTILIQSSFAQNTQTKSLLSSYYDIKNALVNSDAGTTATQAASFLKAIAAVDAASMSATEATSFKAYQEKLSFDARHISQSKDIAHQREHFASLSLNFSKLAKGIKLSDKPIYYDYCPMIKSYWLSAEKEIKNPYYGKTMESCGSISATL